ncbi:DUF222 domain-containing protein [Geodermatophilus marinus]|uniref:DUF222 domain-containing protein n=1 Tax=Geodermatophilus sp. LHW52908 TaxID=2303986 RepID=UPI000E3B88B8|nr:DUF222 domain-containing protein [Geodermatophilus sp. LHW52908]RFU21995.1 HNH endonuclease [Geodermatophilus sp. LHW52908]
MPPVAAPPADPAVVAPAAGWASGPLGVVQAAEREMARLVAVQATAVAEFADARPASVDRPQGQRGAMSAERWAARPELLREVSEWAAPELAVALSCSERSAELLLERSLTLVLRLPGVHAALQEGRLHRGQLWVFLDLVAPLAEDAVRAAVEAQLLGWVAARTAGGRVTTPAQLRDKARRVLAGRGLRQAAQDLAAAIRARGVAVVAERTAGMASLSALLTLPEARAVHAALGACVDALPADPGDARSRGERMADCLVDLVLRPGEGAWPPVQVALTLVASLETVLGGEAPGELDGQVISAEMVRQLLRLLTGTPAGTGDDPTDDPTDDPDDPGDTGTGAAGGAGPAGGAGAGGDAGWLDWAGDDDPALAPDLTPAQRRALAAAEARWWADRDREVFGEGEVFGDDPMPGFGAGMVDDLLAPSSPGPPGPEEWPPGPPAPEAPPPGPAAPGDRTGDTAPGDTAPGDTAPGDTAPGDTAPGDTAPGDAAVGSGWWAAADAAVTDAASAAHQALLALARARRLVRTAEHAAAADEHTWRTRPAAALDAAATSLAALAAAGAADRAALGALLAATAGGGLADRPRLALVDALTGALIALTDLPALRRTGACARPGCRRAPAGGCPHDLTGRPGLGAPGSTAGYRPGAALDRFLRARDRRCRFPGCRRRVPAGGELDHRIRYPDGPTAAANMAGFCTGHHRGKHQAPGWTHTPSGDAALTVTTPAGLTATTDPPPYGDQDCPY